MLEWDSIGWEIWNDGRACGGQLNTGTQRISFFSFEVSSNVLQRLCACMTVQEKGARRGEWVTMCSEHSFSCCS